MNTQNATDSTKQQRTNIWTLTTTHAENHWNRFIPRLSNIIRVQSVPLLVPDLILDVTGTRISTGYTGNSILQMTYHSPYNLCDSWKVTFLRRPSDVSTSMSPIFSRESEEIRIPRRAASVLLGIRGPSLQSSVPMVTFTHALKHFTYNYTPTTHWYVSICSSLPA